MHTKKSNQKTKTTKIKQTESNILSIKRNAFTFAAVSLGVMVGVVSAMSLVMPMARTALASDVSGIGRTIQFKTAADTLTGSCTAPTTGASSNTGSSQSSAGTTPVVSSFVKPQGPTNLLTSKIVSGIFGNQTAAISNTGPGSTNKVITDNQVTTTVTNTNDVAVSNSNNQSANSGSATTKNNTTGGSSTTGASTNTNSTDYTFNINN